MRGSNPRTVGLAVAAVGGLVAAVTGAGIAIASNTGGSSDAASNAASVIDTSGWPSAKASAFQEYTQRVHASTSTLSAPPQGSAAQAAPTDASPTARASGVTQGGSGSYPAGDFEETGSYAGEAGGRWVIIYAGALGDEVPDKGLGAVHVLTEPLDSESPLRELGVVKAPAGTGILTIKDREGDDLLLTAPDGSTQTFDLVSLTFIS